MLPGTQENPFVLDGSSPVKPPPKRRRQRTANTPATPPPPPSPPTFIDSSPLFTPSPVQYIPEISLLSEDLDPLSQDPSFTQVPQTPERPLTQDYSLMDTLLVDQASILAAMSEGDTTVADQAPGPQVAASPDLWASSDDDDDDDDTPIKRPATAELPESVSECLEHIFEKKSVLVTGAAGTGKSFFIRSLVAVLKENGLKCQTLSPTNIAATLVQGRTLHSFLSLSIDATSSRGFTARTHYEELRDRKRSAFEDIRSVDVLVIDEASMINAGFFELLVEIVGLCKGVSARTGPLGSLHSLVVVADFCQLLPIDGKKLAFEAPQWEKLIKTYVKLKEVHRQTNPDLVHHLQRLRMGEFEESDAKYWKQYDRDLPDNDPTSENYVVTIATSNRSVHRINAKCLEAFQGPTITTKAADTFCFRDAHFEGLDELLDQFVALKLHVPIMMIQPTMSVEKGSTGIVIGFLSPPGFKVVRNIQQNPDSLYSVIGDIETLSRGSSCHLCETMLTAETLPTMFRGPFSNGLGYEGRDISDEEFKLLRQYLVQLDHRSRHSHRGEMRPVVLFKHPRKMVATLKAVKADLEFHRQQGPTREQLPCRLGFAVTFHKAQGQSMDKVKVKLSGRYPIHGAAYVGVSRCTSPDGLWVAGLTREMVVVDERVKKFYDDNDLW